jgi:hypothetical protein
MKRRYLLECDPGRKDAARDHRSDETSRVYGAQKAELSAELVLEGSRPTVSSSGRQPTKTAPRAGGTRAYECAYRFVSTIPLFT